MAYFIYRLNKRICTMSISQRPNSLEDRDARLQKIAGYSRLALEGMSVNELRELGAFLLPKARKLKKNEFIDALLDISESFRARRLEELILTMKLMEDFDIKEDFLSKSLMGGLSPEQCSEIIKNEFESRGYKPSTIAKTKMKQLRNLLESVTLKNEGSKEWCDEVYQHVSKYASSYHHEVNQDYAAKVEGYGTEETVKIIDGQKIISWASEVIDWAVQQNDIERGWHKVSFALALTSGRRMDEIHGHAKFEVIDSENIRTIGLAKKSVDDFELKSPVLVDAYKWVKALNMLPEKRRNQINAVVNGVIRKAIAESFGGCIFSNLGLEKYKDARDFYASYLLTHKYKREIHGSEISFVKKILGHEGKRQSLSYQKFVVV